MTVRKSAMGRNRDRVRSDFEGRMAPLLKRAAGYALAILGNRADAEDAVQEAALKGFRAFAGFDPNRSFKGWWFAIVRNCCRDLQRKRQARPSPVAVDQVDSAKPPSQQLEEQEELREALAQIAPTHREIIELRYFGDCSYRDLARALEIPQGTVMSRLHAARQSLAAVVRARNEAR